MKRFIQTTNSGKYVDFVTTQFSIPGTKAGFQNDTRQMAHDIHDAGVSF